MLFPPKKPIRFSGEFSGAAVELTLDSYAGDLTAQFISADSSKCTDLRVTSASGCQITVELPEELALNGAGYYFIVLSDDCDECDRYPVVLEADCRITSVKTETSSNGGERCEC